MVRTRTLSRGGRGRSLTDVIVSTGLVLCAPRPADGSAEACAQCGVSGPLASEARRSGAHQCGGDRAYASARGGAVRAAIGPGARCSGGPAGGRCDGPSVACARVCTGGEKCTNGRAVGDHDDLVRVLMRDRMRGRSALIDAGLPATRMVPRCGPPGCSRTDAVVGECPTHHFAEWVLARPIDLCAWRLRVFASLRVGTEHPTRFRAFQDCSRT